MSTDTDTSPNLARPWPMSERFAEHLKAIEKAKEEYARRVQEFELAGNPDREDSSTDLDSVRHAASLVEAEQARLGEIVAKCIADGSLR